MAEEQNILRLLLIDDEPLARFVARKALEKTGAFVTEAETLKHAEELWSGNAFDLIVCDHRLPDGKGVELVGRMRESGRQEPVVYLTAEKEEITPAVAEQLHLVKVMGKPLDMDIFQLVLDGLTGSASIADSADDTGGSCRRVGTFLVQSLTAGCGVDDMQPLRQSFAGEAYVALDVSAIGHFDSACIAFVMEWATLCRVAGGRFCLLGLSDAMVNEDEALQLRRELDCVETEAELLPLSRHLSSPSERRAVLDSVVMRELL